jgi:serine protease AprX
MIKTLALCLCLMLSVNIFSQNALNRQKIIDKNKQVKFKAERLDPSKYSLQATNEDKSRALSLGVPMRFTDYDGVVGEFIRFDGDLPIYYRTYNVGSAKTSRTNMLYTGGGLGLNLTGFGMIAGLWDENHPRMNHTDYGTRIQIMDGSATAISGHSSHVIGTILSSGASDSTGKGRGMAFEAEGWVNDWTNDFAEMEMLAEWGLLLSNHSYGAVATNLPRWYFGAYVSDARAIDNICFNNPFYLPVYAAGNDRTIYQNINAVKGGNDLLTQEKVAKNTLVVGAVNELQNYNGPAGVILADFTNFGPTDDFRIKPDIVTKGVDVFSTLGGTNTAYGSLSGTSMAAPGITGSLLLLQQLYVGLHGNDENYLRSASLKGLLINTADEAGPSAGPDHMYGWGLANIGKAAQVIQGKGVSSFIEEKTLSSSNTYTVRLVPDNSGKLSVTLSWTDRGGVAVSNEVEDSSVSRLVNDLDLRITGDGQEYFPWKLNKNFQDLHALKGDNDVDNLEKIEIDNPNLSAVYYLTVSHKGNLVGGSQDYSLIVNGIDVQSSMSVQKSDFDNLNLWSRDKVLYYSSSYDLDGVTLEIYDLGGRLICSNVLDDRFGELNLSYVTEGIYILTMKKDGLVFNKKLSIK